MKQVVTITIEVDMDNRFKSVGDHFEYEVSEVLEKIYNRMNWTRDTRRREGKTKGGTVYRYGVEKGELVL